MASKQNIENLNLNDISQLIPILESKKHKWQSQLNKIKKELEFSKRDTDNVRGERDQLIRLLKAIENNITNLDDGDIKDEHFRRQEAMQLRLDVLQKRAAKFDLTKSIQKELRVDVLTKWVIINEELLDQVKSRRDEIISQSQQSK